MIDYENVKKGAVTYRGTVTSAASLGQIIQQARLERGITQRQMAERLGISQRYVWEIESGKQSLFAERLFAMLRETGVVVSAEFEGVADEATQPDRRARDHG